MYCEFFRGVLLVATERAGAIEHFPKKIRIARLGSPSGGQYTAPQTCRYCISQSPLLFRISFQNTAHPLRCGAVYTRLIVVIPFLPDLFISIRNIVNWDSFSREYFQYFLKDTSSGECSVADADNFGMGSDPAYRFNTAPHPDILYAVRKLSHFSIHTCVDVSVVFLYCLKIVFQGVQRS